MPSLLACMFAHTYMHEKYPLSSTYNPRDILTNHFMEYLINSCDIIPNESNANSYDHLAS